MSSRRTPRLYPDAVTLRPGVLVDALLDCVQLGRGCSIKDSFADVNLTSRGFEELFGAHWIYMEPVRDRESAAEPWSIVDTEEELVDWAQTAGLCDVFGPELLRDVTVRALQRRGPSGVDAGAVVNRTGSVVGVSNVFSIDMSATEVWTGAVAAISREFPALPIVGYERGEDLHAALASGFEAIGRLRVWLQTEEL